MIHAGIQEDKMIIFILFSIQILFAIKSEAKEVRTITINSHGNNTGLCLNGTMPCLSLSFAAQHIKSNVHFHVEGSVVLKHIVTFNSTFEISIYGSNNSELLCYQNTGFQFLYTRSVVLQNISFVGCGFQRGFVSTDFYYQNAIFMLKSCNIFISNVVIQNSHGYGVILTNSYENVTISNTRILNSKPGSDSQKTIGGAGMLILASSCDVAVKTCNQMQNQPAHYHISDTIFSNNFINISSLPENIPWAFYYGGGLGILMWWGACGNTFIIVNSTFNNNQSPNGAGLSIHYNLNSVNNSVRLIDCNFTNNSELTFSLGGAGASIGVTSEDSIHYPIGNNVSFEGCVFNYNTGYYGAGSLIYSAAAPSLVEYPKNHFSFNNCRWELNSGMISPAIDIEPDFYSLLQSSFLVNAIFIDCKFLNNKFTKRIQGYHQYQAGSGIFLVTRLKVYFSGDILFQGNNGSALILYSATAIVSEGSALRFISNRGGASGAFVLFELSSLRYWNNTLFYFENNQAIGTGGAMYVFSYLEHQQFSSRTCFMGYANLTSHTSTFGLNVTFVFKGNVAKLGFANSIYIDTIKPCQYSCLGHNGNVPTIQKLFSNDSCLGQFYFLNETILNSIATDPVKFTLTSPPPYGAIPGRKQHIPLSITDELGNDATDTTVLQSYFQAENISLDGSMFVTNNNIILTGIPGSATGLALYDPKSYNGLSVSVYLDECPPGYISTVPVNNSLDATRCVCSFGTNYEYRGVTGCDELEGVALVHPGTWIGYIGDDANENNLFTGSCFYCNSAIDNGEFKLLPFASKDMLEKLICPSNKRGILCSECKKDHSVFFHSSTFNCYSNKLCNIGFIIYFLGEIVPTGILFLVVILFNISLTSGYAYSLVFMAQIISDLSRFQTVGLTGFQSVLEDIASSIYSVTNLEFLKFDRLSFCLWAGAKSLDILMMKYVSVLFAIGLVICTVLVIRHCKCNLLMKIQQMRRPNTLNGLLAILVICYSHCASVAFKCLIAVTLVGKGGKEYPDRFVMNAAVKYFSMTHFFYAIPAIIFISTVVIPIPTLLFLDPFLLKLESFICQCIPCPLRFSSLYPWTKFRNRLKPVFDSFHGCFKDKFRSVSGLFFLYRIVFLLDTAFSPDRRLFLGLIQFLFILMFAMQALLQPFHEHKHNILALLVFLNLTLINSCSVAIYLLLDSKDLAAISFLNWFQLFLTYLPLLCAATWGIWRGFQLLRTKFLPVPKETYKQFEALADYHMCND